jgi:hypothetical protein
MSCHGEREREREREREIDKRRNVFYMQRDSHPIFVCHQDLEGQEMLLDRMQK